MEFGVDLDQTATGPSQVVTRNWRDMEFPRESSSHFLQGKYLWYSDEHWIPLKIDIEEKRRRLEHHFGFWVDSWLMLTLVLGWESIMSFTSSSLPNLIYGPWFMMCLHGSLQDPKVIQKSGVGRRGLSWIKIIFSSCSYLDGTGGK